MMFVQLGARFLVKRVIAKAGRSDGKVKNSAANVIAIQERGGLYE